jgi:predicted Zn-dependent protease
MEGKVVRVRRKRRVRSFRDVDSVSLFRHHLTPARLGVYAASIALAVVLSVVLFTYGQKAYRGWRETRLLKHAIAMLAQKNYPAATTAAHEMLELHPDSLSAYQILAEATEKENLEETVAWRAQIARLLPSSTESKLNLASAALRFGQLDLARKALKNIPPDQRGRAAYHVIAGWLARAEGNLAEQESQFAAAVKKEPNNDLYQFNLAALQIRSPDSEKSAHARSVLQRLAQGNVEFRTGALRPLLNDAIGRNDLVSAEAFAQDLQMAPQVAFSDYLLCLNFYRKLNQKKFETVLQKVKPVAARDRGDTALLMNWMNDNGLAADVLKWMDKLPPELTDKPPAAVAIAEAFAEVKNWSRLRRWTRNGLWEGANHVRLAYQAFSAHQSRQSSADAEFESLWQAAERATNEQPEKELELARLATKWNLAIEAEQLWSRLSHVPSARREALDALYRFYRNNNDLKKLYDVLQHLHDSSPNEAPITADLARLGLNIEQNTRQSQDLAKEAFDRAPLDPNCAITYAFSLFATGRTTEGIDIIKKLPPEELHDPHAAVYVAVLLLDDNQIDAAKEYIDAAHRGTLYAEEKRLLEDELAKVAGTASTPSPSPSGSAEPKTSPPVPSAAPAPSSLPTP